jgi:hypothetical protein
LVGREWRASSTARKDLRGTVRQGGAAEIFTSFWKAAADERLAGWSRSAARVGE